MYILNQVTDKGDDYVSLTWGKPEHDGGSSILGYCLWKQQEGKSILLSTRGQIYLILPSGTTTWDKCFKTKLTECQIVNLQTDAKMQFKVCAFNEAGNGDEIETTAAVTVKRILGVYK